MELTNFLGGLWVPPYFTAQAPNNALITADNIEYGHTGAVQGRRGRTLYGTLPAKAISLWRHYPRTGSPATLAAVDNGASVELRHDTASNGTFATVTGGAGLATGKRLFFTNWGSKDRSFFANGVGLYSYNGVITNVVQTGPQITGPYVVVHQSRLFGTKADEINYSVYATDVNDELTVNAANQLNVSDPQGGSITGLASLPDRLLILKNTSLWVMLGDIKFSAILTKLTETGCVAPLSIAQAPYGVFFVGRSGVYLTDGQRPEPIDLSGPIRSLFTPPTTNVSYPNAVGIYYARKDMYKVKLDPAHGYTYCLQRIQVPGARGVVWAWSRNTNEPLVSGNVWDSEGDTGDPYVSDSGGNVYRADSGATDAGVAYASVVQPVSLRLSDELSVGHVHYVHLLYRGSGAATVGLRYNNAAADDLTLSLGQAQAIGLQRTRKMVTDKSKSGQFVSPVITLPGDGPGAELYSLKLDARVRSRRVWR